MGLGFFVHHGDKALGKLVFTAAAHIEIADNRERERTDKVNEKVLHRIQQANIQIAAQTKGRLGAVTLYHDHIRDIADDEEFEKTKAMLRLMCELGEGRRSGEEEGWVPEEDVRAHFRMKNR